MAGSEPWTALLRRAAAPPPARSRRSFGSAWRRWDRPVVGVLAIVALGLGWWGASIGPQDPAFSTKGLHPLSTALKHFFLNGPSSGCLPWQTEVARLLAPAIPVYAAIATVLAVSRDRWQDVRVRGWTGHAVVLGLDDVSVRLVADLRRRGRRVAVLVQDARSPLADRARAVGAVVLEGDPRDEHALASVRPERAGLVAVFAGGDVTNIAVAGQLVRVVARARKVAAHGSRETTGPASPDERPSRGAGGRADADERAHARVRCAVRVEDGELRDRVRSAQTPEAVAAGVDLCYVSVAEGAATLACTDHLATALGRSSDGPTHLIVVGLGRFGEALILEAARSPASTATGRLRVTVVDRDAASKLARLKDRYPPLAGGVDPTTQGPLVTLEARALDLTDGHRAAELVRDLLGPLDRRMPTAVAICLRNERLGLSLAHALAAEAKQGVTVLLRMSEEGGCADAIGRCGIGALGIPHARPIAVLDEVCAADWVDASPIDAAAHQTYVNTTMAKHARDLAAGKADPPPTIVEWQQLRPDLKASSRAQALHIPWKLARLGLEAAPQSDPRPEATIADADVRTLAELEHARWNAERLLGGWRHTQGKRNDDKRLNPSLVPWNQLTDDVQAYDFDAVRAIPAMLQGYGLKIVRRNPSTA
ncbi:MAG: NAD-binding protein [Planctomycetes bacterium]|nr:NAD-binding protein [Planctomycetota bacterium]